MIALGNKAWGFQFALLFALIALLSFIWTWYPVAGLAIGLSSVSAFLAAVAPNLLDVPNRLWTSFGKLLGRFLGPVILAIVFFILLTPFALVSRLVSKRDPLMVRGNHPSTWVKAEIEVSEQFFRNPY